MIKYIKKKKIIITNIKGIISGFMVDQLKGILTFSNDDIQNERN